MWYIYLEIIKGIENIQIMSKMSEMSKKTKTQHKSAVSVNK